MDTKGNVLARPAYVTLCYGPDGPVYLVAGASQTKDRAFMELEEALGFAQQYNNERHQGAAPYFQNWENRVRVQLRVPQLTFEDGRRRAESSCRQSSAPPTAIPSDP